MMSIIEIKRMLGGDMDQRVRCFQGAETHRSCRTILLIFLLIPLFRPRFAQQAFGDEGVFFFRCWLCVSVLVATFVLVKRRRFVDVYVLTVFALLAIILFSTIVNGGSKMTWVDNWLGCWVATAIVFAFRDDMVDLLISLYIVAFSLSLLDFVSMIAFPGGIFTPSVYFYGNRNAAFQVFLPAMLAGYLLSIVRSKRFRVAFSAATLVGAGQLYCGGSETSTIAFVLLLLLLAAMRLGFPSRFVNIAGDVAMSLMGFMLVVVGRAFSAFAVLITGIMGKSITLSGRTLIWDKLFAMTDLPHVLLGWGVSGHELLVINGTHYYYAHNMFLEFWLVSGLLGLVFFAGLLWLTIQSSWKARGERSAAIIAAILGAYMVIGVVETMVGPSFFLVLALAYCWPHWISQSKLQHSL